MRALSFTDPQDTDEDGLFDADGGEGRRVTLRTDPSRDLFDRYGRLLAARSRRPSACRSA